MKYKISCKVFIFYYILILLCIKKLINWCKENIIAFKKKM